MRTFLMTVIFVLTTSMAQAFTFGTDDYRLTLGELEDRIEYIGPGKYVLGLWVQPDKGDTIHKLCAYATGVPYQSDESPSLRVRECIERQAIANNAWLKEMELIYPYVQYATFLSTDEVQHIIDRIYYEADLVEDPPEWFTDYAEDGARARGKLRKKLTALTERVDEHDRRLGTLNERLNGHDWKIDALDKRIDTLEAKPPPREVSVFGEVNWAFVLVAILLSVLIYVIIRSMVRKSKKQDDVYAPEQERVESTIPEPAVSRTTVVDVAEGSVHVRGGGDVMVTWEPIKKPVHSNPEPTTLQKGAPSVTFTPDEPPFKEATVSVDGKAVSVPVELVGESTKGENLYKTPYASRVLESNLEKHILEQWKKLNSA